MQKKIVAVSLVVLMIAVLLASCGNKYLMAEVGGVERPLVTDAEGNTEIDNEGKIAVYVTDAKGNIKENDDGSPMKNYYPLPDVFVNGNTLETLKYKFTMPDGWKLKDDGIFYKDASDDKCTVTCSKSGTLGDLQTFEMYTSERIDYVREEVIEKLKAQYPDSSFVETNGTLTDGRPVVFVTTTIKNPDGSLFYYAISTYVAIEDDVYNISYVCDGGTGYDESFDFMGVFSSNFIVK